MVTESIQIDILYPLASLKWTESSNLPVDMCDAQALWLKDKLYVGGGLIPKSFRNTLCQCLFVYSPNTDTWSTLETPVYSFALTTYRSQLVIVGGWTYDECDFRWGSPTDKVWILNKHVKLEETVIPPMITKRYHASSVEYKDRILVAGGYSWESEVNSVEVYNGYEWTETQCLPKPCYKMKSTILNGLWYLMGGETQGTVVYYASLNALVGISQSSGWKRLKDVPHECSSPVVFQNRLMVIGGGTGTTSAYSSIYSYSAYTQSWIHEGDIPTKLNCTCTAILPTGKLTVIGGQRFGVLESRVFQATLKYGKKHDVIQLY